MKELTFCAGSTYGDTYVTTCKLSSFPSDTKINIVHRVVCPDKYEPVVKEIYGVLPNVSVTVVDDKHDVTFPEIQTYPPGAVMLDGTVPKDPEGVVMNWFPNFTFADITKFNLPKRYKVMVPTAGGLRKWGYNWRMMPDHDVDVAQSEEIPTVVLGITGHSALKPDMVINLIGKTSIAESQEIVKNSVFFIGCEGLLFWTALSMRVVSVGYIHRQTERIIRQARLIGPWSNYCVDARVYS